MSLRGCRNGTYGVEIPASIFGAQHARVSFPLTRAARHVFR